MSLHYQHQTSFYLFSLLLILIPLLVSSQTTDSIAQGQLIRDGQTIISAGKVFELGFFSPRNSTSRFVGIWYYRIPIQTVVWVANRQNPISGNLGVLSMGYNGNLMVMDGNGGVVWSTGSSLGLSSTNTSSTSTAVLLDNGNFILSSKDIVGNDTSPLWQSYDHPADTYLFGMKIHVMNSLKGENYSFVSWKSDNDPSYGNCTMGMDPRASPQIVTWNGTQRLWRSGHWNGKVFLGVPSSGAVFPFEYRLHTGPEGPYFTFVGINMSILMNFRMRWDGIVEQVTWDESAARWIQRLREPSNDCGNYNRCGNFGICSMTDSIRCSCMKGFVPNYLHQWNAGNWSGGCIRRTPLQCVTQGNVVRDGFIEMTKTKFPDDADRIMANQRDCKEGCLRNCSCNAYAFIDRIGCMTWSGDLKDIEKFQMGGGTLYIRLSNSELGKGKKSSKSTIAAIISALLGTPCVVAVIWFLWRIRVKLRGLSTSLWNDNKPLRTVAGESQEFSIDSAAQDEFSTALQNGVPLPQFSFNSIEVSTDTFSNKNKLGEGGFGPVYKGILQGGQVIAVKRLSKWSGQGIEEFKNELMLIAKLQHRNLVRLLGYCIEGEEKLLIYEYMPNKSLDTFLFDPVKKAELEWSTRSMIIEGIARGLLYLHRDSRLRIIHRDLKVSNILLDEEMNPKISDFGMARIFGGNQIEANTIRVVGTYGYMSPEYAMEGLFSVKSDVYSFGVLLLEIVSGQKSNSFRSDECLNLIQHARNLWKEGKTEELIDPSIAKSCTTKEALQCVHVAMLCVQMSPVNRPTMASVVLMLESENANLPQPLQTDLKAMSYGKLYSVVQDHDISESANDVTITPVTGR